MTTPEDVFVGPAVELSVEPLSSMATLTYRALADIETAAAATPAPDAAPPTPWGRGAVRHAAGYGPFVDYVRAQGDDPRALALSATAGELVRYLRAHTAAFTADPALLDAASIFVGNYIASLRADAAWRAVSPGKHEVGAGRYRFIPSTILERLTLPNAGSGLPDADIETQLQGFTEMVKQWVAEAADDALPPPPLPTPRPAASGTPRYERPLLPSPVFLDEAGEPIDYGNRWHGISPPEDSYSVARNSERFAGLHTVAHALIDHLQRVYDVEVTHEKVSDAAALLLRPHGGVRKLVRVQPQDPQAAPLRFVLTDYPGVIVEAGVLHGFAYPMCGCEACDEGLDAVSTELEQLVLAVASGGYAEHYPVGRRRDLHYGLVTLDSSGATVGSRGGHSAPDGISAERLARGEAVLAALPRGWQPWPLRD